MRRGRDLDLRPRWGLDGDALIAKVAAWTPVQALALLDACERVRAVARQGKHTTLAELLRAAGLPRGEMVTPRSSSPRVVLPQDS